MSRELRLTLLLIMLAGYGLRVWRLDYQELRGDEAFGYFFGQSPYAQIIADTLSLREPHPVASYFVQKAWLSLAGDSEFALRYVSAWFSVAAIALLARLGKRSGLPDSVAAFSAALMAASPYVIWHAQDARMYSMSLALTLASSLAALVWLQRGTAARGVLYVVVSLFALHTHYFAVFVLLAQNVYAGVQAIAHKIDLGKLARWLGLQAAVAVLYAPWLFMARRLLLGYHGNGDSPPLGEALMRSFSVFVAGESAPADQRMMFGVFGLALAVMGLTALAARSDTRAAAWWYGLYLGIPIVATWYGATARPIFDERYLASAAPPFYVLAATALLAGYLPAQWARAPRPLWLRFGAAALIVLFAAGAGVSLVRHYTDPAYSKTRGWRQLAERLEQIPACMHAEEVRLAQNYPDPTLWYYYAGTVDHLVLPPAAQSGDEALSLVNTLAAEGVRWVAFVEQPAANWDADGLAHVALAEQYAPALKTDAAGWPVTLFVRPPQTLQPAETVFANGAILSAYAVDPARTVAAGALVAHLQWDTTQMSGAPDALKVFVQLLDGQGRLAAQQDQPLQWKGADAAAVVSYGILLPETLAPGEYTLIAGLYRPNEDGAPRVPLRVDRQQDYAVLQTLIVGPADGCATDSAAAG